MADPVTPTIAAILQKFAYKKAVEALDSSAGFIFDSLTSGEIDPRLSGELQTASREAIREAARFRLGTLATHVYPKRPLLEIIREEKGHCGLFERPIVEWGTQPERTWCKAFERATQDAKKFADFRDSFVFEEGESNALIANESESALAAKIHTAFLQWLRRHVQEGEEPGFIEAWVSNGWTPDSDKPGTTITLYSVYRWFFQKKLTQNSDLFNQFAAEALARIRQSSKSIEERVGRLADQQALATLTTDDLETWGSKQLGVWKESLLPFDKRFDELQNKITEGWSSQGEILAACITQGETLDELVHGQQEIKQKLDDIAKPRVQIGPPKQKLCALPFESIGNLFKGTEHTQLLRELETFLCEAK